MDENNKKLSKDEQGPSIPESPKPLAFTIDFGEGKSVDTERHKSLVEKYQKRHRRGQSLSKLEDSDSSTPPKKPPLTGNLPRKSSFQSEGYFSSDERSERSKNVRSALSNVRKSDLTLPLKNVTSDKMTQSFPSCNLPSISSPDTIELKDVSSPELDLISPFSPNGIKPEPPMNIGSRSKVELQCSGPECESKDLEENFIDGTEFDFDKSDTVSDAGTYTLETDNYSEEQKARMSIDTDFKIEQVSLLRKTQEYVQSLNNPQSKPRSLSAGTRRLKVQPDLNGKLHALKIKPNETQPKSPQFSPTTDNTKSFPFHSKERMTVRSYEQKPKLSPILSPTQNISITQNIEGEPKQINNDADDGHEKTFTKIMFPSPKAKTGICLEQVVDQGSVISITSSGAFRSKSEKDRGHVRQLSLTKSEIHVEAYTGSSNDGVVHNLSRPKAVNLSTTVFKVQSIPTRTCDTKNNGENFYCDPDLVYGNLVLGKMSNLQQPSAKSGKASPTKIPSPVHNLSRPRSRNSVSSLNVDLSDSSLETESFLKPTENFIMTLERRLPFESDLDSDYDSKCVTLNNDTRNLLKQKLTHVRHNSFDDRNLKVCNKLEHFQNKNLQGIDQTKQLNQYPQNRVIHKIQNSPNNSPIRRSSSFSTKNQINSKNTNLKEVNITNSPNFTRNSSIQRSASTANIKPRQYQFRRSSINSDRKTEYDDTDSSSDEECQQKKDGGNITNTKCNRAFALRRARLDVEPVPVPKCPNTPEMRRKFPSDSRPERAISVDRRPTKSNEVQSRYLLNLSKRSTTSPKPQEQSKSMPKSAGKTASNKPQAFARTDSGRMSMRTPPKPPTSNMPKSNKKSGKCYRFFIFIHGILLFALQIKKIQI